MTIYALMINPSIWVVRMREYRDLFIARFLPYLLFYCLIINGERFKRVVTLCDLGINHNLRLRRSRKSLPGSCDRTTPGMRGLIFSLPICMFRSFAIDLLSNNSLVCRALDEVVREDGIRARGFQKTSYTQIAAHKRSTTTILMVG